jgi:type I restriction enzyme, S subunit
MKAGWQTKQLGEICEIERGGSPRPIQSFITTESNGINWIKIGDATASGKYIFKTEEKIRPEGIKRSRMVYDGDFILSNSMSFGRPYIMKTTGCIHDGWLVLRQPKVNQDFLYHVLGSDLVFEQFDRLAAGSTVRNLNIGLAKSVEIPIPPLPEQERIVGILDEAFDGIAKAKATAEANLQNARALFQSHLQTVFSQKGEGWVETTLDKISTNLDTQRIPITKSDRKAGQYPYYGASGIVDYVEDYIFDGDTLLISEDGANLLARSTPIAFSVSGRYWVNNHAHILKFEDMATQRYVEFYIASIRLDEYITGAAQPKLNQRALNSITIPIPTSVTHRTGIVQSLESIQEETQRLESLYQNKLNALDELKKSLLHQAFTGRL